MDAKNIKNPLLRKFVKVHCEKLKLPISRIGKCEYWNEEKKEDTKKVAKHLSLQILLFAGMSEETAKAAFRWDGPTWCDHEFSVGDWNFSTKYDLCMLSSVIKLADRLMSGDKRTEVGMKYPEFKKESLIKKYKLQLTGTHIDPRYLEDDFYKDRLEMVTHEIWQNENRTISFTFTPDRMGKGGYAGATFPTHEKAIEFTKWFFKHKSWYVKDWDLFENGLGGLGLKEIDNYNVKWNEEQREKKHVAKEVKTYGKKTIAITKPVLVKKLKYAVIVETKGKNPVRLIKI